MSESDRNFELLTIAINLLHQWKNVAGRRRHIEGVCGWPEEYGGDQKVWEDTNDFFKLLRKMLDEGLIGKQ